MGVVLLVRHGRTQANVDGILAGRTPGVVLDDHGIASVTELCSRLENVPVAHVVTSPLERTRQTAQLAFGLRAPISDDDRLLECDYGQWQGRLLKELAEDPLWKVVQQRPDEMIFPSGESMTEMSRRAVTAIREWDEKLSAEHGNDVIWAAVSHGDIIKAICADALGMSLNKFQKIVIDPASISVVQFGEHGSSVAKLNDTGTQWLTTLRKVAPQLGGQSGKDDD